MKTKLIFALLLTFIFGGWQLARAQTGQTLKLQVNRQKRIPQTNLTLHFVSVLDDSRCPEDANCVWAGNAKTQIKIRKANGGWKTFELNSNLEPKTVSFEGYEIKLINLDPKLRTNIRINRNGYTATFTITKT